MMKSLKYGIAAVALLIATPVWAQTAAEIVRDTVFSEVEKRIIGEHYGVKVQDMVQDTGMPDWAVKTDPDTDMEGRDKDEDGDKKKGKNNKGGKWGGKDKGKDKLKGLPPGLAKRKTLPPGLQKQLDKNGRLPPGLAKRDLPDDLTSKMPKRDNSQEITVVDDDVVLIDKTTGVILDVIKDVISARTGGSSGTGSTTNPNGTLADPGLQTGDTTQSGGVINSILKSIFGGN